MKTEADFWARVDQTGECWPWTHSLNENGYGQFNWAGFPERLAHRMAYRLTHGEIPTGLTIDHLCGNKPCCNPAHMEAVTSGENSRRWAVGKVTCQFGRHVLAEVGKTSRGDCRACYNEHERRLYQHNPVHRRRRKERARASYRRRMENPKFRAASLTRFADWYAQHGNSYMEAQCRKSAARALLTPSTLDK